MHRVPPARYLARGRAIARNSSRRGHLGRDRSCMPRRSDAHGSANVDRDGEGSVTTKGLAAPPPAPLVEILAARIAANGPITFAEYMETALYDPQHGYYT